ncbi:MAG: hypothetical protein ACXAB4_11880 [Candidatus Hodarchaeales archaeon]
MNANKHHPVRELFVMTSSGIPMATVGTGDITADATLMGGLLTAIQSFGSELGANVSNVEFHEFRAVYALSEQAIVVLITSEEASDFYLKASQELVSIAEELERRGITDKYEIHQTAETEKEINEIIGQKAKTIFAQQNDVFIFDENHAFQFSRSSFERWNGEMLLRNYLLRSSLMEQIAIPEDNFKQLCEIMHDKKRPSEILAESALNMDSNALESILKFLFMFDIIVCYELGAQRTS